MDSKPYKFLFLCTGNSARSIIGEYLLRWLGGPRFEVFRAGAFPTGRVNPFAVQVLKDVYNIDASEARSNSWEEFKDVELILSLLRIEFVMSGVCGRTDVLLG